MKKIIFEKKLDQVEINFEDVESHKPIFAKKKGKLIGMVVQDFGNDYWILRTGGTAGATGYHDSLRKCLESCEQFGFEFFVN